MVFPPVEVPYESPLKGIIPPILSNNEKLNEFFVSWGFTRMSDHIDELVGAALFYQTIFVLSSVLSPKLVSSYNKLSRRTQINFDIHVVSMVQSVLIIVISYPLFFESALDIDRYNGYTPYAGFISAMACGYFLWDSIICARYAHMFGIGFLVHGICALSVYVQSLRPYLMYWSPYFLFFELSTPFLNVHWFATHLPAGIVPDSIQVVNGLCLMGTFFTARILWGFYHAVLFGKDALYNYDLSAGHPSIWVPVSMLGSNMILNSLNVFWFSKMISLARKKLGGSVKKTSKKTD